MSVNKQQRYGSTRKAGTLSAFQNFLHTPLETQLQQSLHTNPETQVLQLFQELAATVPAYQAFLQERRIEPQTIQTFADFQSLPLLTKANYPENIQVGLEQPETRDWVTGKFVMEVKEDDDKNRFLAITVELAPTLTGNEEMEKAIAFSIYTQLVRLNSEFTNYVPPQYQLPQITLLSFGDPEYFPIGVKHRYTRSQD